MRRAVCNLRPLATSKACFEATNRLDGAKEPLAQPSHAGPAFTSSKIATRSVETMLPLAKYRYARKPARRLLEGISRAARPVELEVVVIATADVQDATSALGSLQRARLIRGTSRGQRRFTAYHDRVRETVSASLGFARHPRQSPGASAQS